MSQRWFRVYDDLISNHKVQRLPAELFKALINLWCLASQNGGLLPSIDEIAFGLRTKTDKAAAIITELRTAGLLDEDETGFRPHNWNARQFKSDVSTSRVKSFRERHRNGGETFHPPFQKRPQIQNTDTETDTEKKETRASRALSVGWPPDYRERFWEAFPNKVGKAHALKSLDKIAVSGVVEWPFMMDSLARYRAKTDDRPFCNPATWLNQERWTDEPRTVIPHSNGKKTLGQACDDLLDKIRTINEPAPICDGESQTFVRQLPAD